MSKKVIITGAKHIIEGECKLIIHIPKVEMPLRMNRIKHFIVRKDVIEFYGNSAKAYKITGLVDAVEVAKTIVIAIENRLPQLTLAENLFGPPVPKAVVVYPTLTSLVKGLKASSAKKLREVLEIDLREWKLLQNGGGLPWRYEESYNKILHDTAVLEFENYIQKPAEFAEDANFWKNIINAESKRTTPTT